MFEKDAMMIMVTAVSPRTAFPKRQVLRLVLNALLVYGHTTLASSERASSPQQPDKGVSTKI